MNCKYKYIFHDGIHTPLRYGFFLLVTGCTLLNTLAAGDHDDHRDPFIPSITKKESDFLNKTLVAASTNVTQGIIMLQESITPESSPALDFAIGNLYFQQDQLDDAESAYQQAIEKFPSFRSAIMNLGRVYLIQNELDKTIELYQQLVANAQADADIYLLLAHAMLMQNHLVSAETAYRQCLLLDPTRQEARMGLAKCLMQQERIAEGLALINELLSKDPVNKELWSLKANACLALDNYEQAIQVIETARRLDCADADMLATLGDLYLNNEQPADAVDAYQHMFELGMSSPERILRALEGFLMVQQTDGAMQMMNQLDALSADNEAAFSEKQQVRLLRAKGELAKQQGDNETAIKLYQKALQQDPLDGRTMLLLSQWLWEQNRLEEAVMQCERAARIQGFEADAMTRQAQIEVERERYAKAVDLLETSLTFEEQANVRHYLEQVRQLRDLE